MATPKIPGFNRLVLASESPIKLRAVSEFFGIPENEILCKNTRDCTLPEQPLGTGALCCTKRKNHVLQKLTEQEIQDYDYIIAIENEIYPNFTDCCNVLIFSLRNNNHSCTGCSNHIKFPVKYYDYIEKNTIYRFNGTDGFSMTIGQAINLCDSDINAKDWMSSMKYNLNHKKTGYTCRFDQITAALRDAFPIEVERYEISKHISLTPDFPKKGVMFKDLSPILSDSDLFHRLIDLSMKIIRNSGISNIDKIVGLDSRGFIYGSALAYVLNAGFIMARKRGKLPYKSDNEKISVIYHTEYSIDALEILKFTVKKDERVLIIDDLMATGGTFRAAADLVEQAGGVVVGYLAILKVDPLYEKAVELLSGGKNIPILIVL
jgi:adenine phosphoribosyltransferase